MDFKKADNRSRWRNETLETVVAHAVEVATVDGRFDRLTRVVCVVDCGPVVHPDKVRAQMDKVCGG